MRGGKKAGSPKKSGDGKEPIGSKKEFRVRFRPVRLAFNCPGPKDSEDVAERAEKMPRGSRRLWGIPFELAREGRRTNVLRLVEEKEAEVTVGATAAHLCFLHYWEGNPLPGNEDAGGEQVGEYTLHYADGASAAVPIRSRFEVGWRGQSWGQHLFAAVSYDGLRTLDFMSGQASRTYGWGRLQTDAAGNGVTEPWIFALPNPRPTQRIRSVVLRGTHQSALCVLGLTLYEGPGHPLRHNARRYFKLALPEAAEVESLSVDLGVLVRDAGPAWPRDKKWVDAVEAGLGVPAGVGLIENVRLLEISAADGATLTVGTKESGRKRTHELSVGQAMQRGASGAGKVRIEVVHRDRAWVQVTIKDAGTGHLIPARVHFSGPNGEYYAPYGHHTVINDNWFEDYGADIKLGQMSYAYVPGRFQTNLPVGEVYVEAAKGFEYRPLRQKLQIKPGQRELELGLQRISDWRSQNWVTADTHVHFISPHTAWLQGQGEGLNLINLLASQWGRLFTNVGDIIGEVGVQKDDTMVWVGTENRNHILGHISMLGTHGDPVFPMCAGGPGEAYVGDPDERTLAEWADECRAKHGVVVRPHFPQPNVENPADIVLGKFDALEIRSYSAPGSGPLDEYTLREYYRYLNCGYRVACVGGTDKMSAGMPVGGVRTYAQLDAERPFDFDNWAEAVRAGRTFSTSGPLISLKVEGRGLGSEIMLSGGRGTVEVHAVAECAWPMTRLDVVVNGQVVATAASKAGVRRLELRDRVAVIGTSWVAARCGSNLKVQHCWPIFVAAHTSPIYVVVPGTDLFSPSDAAYMLTLIDGGLTYLDTLSVRYDEKRHREMKAVYKHAREHLLGRLRKHQASMRHM
jgi:hypothetical protein